MLVRDEYFIVVLGRGFESPRELPSLVIHLSIDTLLTDLFPLA